MSTSHQRNRAHAAIRLALQTRFLTHFVALHAMVHIKGNEITIGNHQTLAI